MPKFKAGDLIKIVSKDVSLSTAEHYRNSLIVRVEQGYRPSNGKFVNSRTGCYYLLLPNCTLVYQYCSHIDLIAEKVS